jgi:hypothetical protein
MRFHSTSSNLLQKSHHKKCFESALCCSFFFSCFLFSCNVVFSTFLCYCIRLWRYILVLVMVNSCKSQNEYEVTIHHLLELFTYAGWNYGFIRHQNSSNQKNVLFSLSGIVVDSHFHF